jgi:Tfp pilus assembly protein PilN
MIANLSISILWLPLIVLLAAFAGFLFRSSQIAKSKKRIIYLENEMLRNHAEILKLQQEMIENERNNVLAHKSRVVPMKESPPDENSEAVQKKKLNK